MDRFAKIKREWSASSRFEVDMKWLIDKVEQLATDPGVKALVEFVEKAAAEPNYDENAEQLVIDLLEKARAALKLWEHGS